MDDYSSLDPYSRSRYEHGIDSKIVIMGNSGVGKTSLLRRYTQNKFDPKNTTSTSGAFFVTKKVYVDGYKVRLQLWDTAGQERFRSMAPMYYRGANAALLLYDITNAATFHDIRGWLEELKRNCSPDLIIYIVGAKADLSRSRQVTSDLARLSLHNWFPPPKRPTAPPPPPPSTLSYIRPRFTSFPSMQSPATVPQSPAYVDLPQRRPSGMQRSRVTAQRTPNAGSGSVAHSNTSRSTHSSRYGADYGQTGWAEDTSSNSLNEEDEDEIDDGDECEWGLSKGMKLFEVSAKDDMGIQQLFDNLIEAIILRKDQIEQENEMKKRDSVFLPSVSSPGPTVQGDGDEEHHEKERYAGSWSCC